MSEKRKSVSCNTEQLLRKLGERKKRQDFAGISVLVNLKNKQVWGDVRF